MNRITELFQRKDRNLLSVYFTAGYPVLEDTVEIIQMLENRGVDLVEIGIPFSDPMADAFRTASVSVEHYKPRSVGTCNIAFPEKTKSVI